MDRRLLRLSKLGRSKMSELLGSLNPHAMLFRKRVGGISRDDVAYPAEHTARSDPETGRQDKP